MKNIPKIHSIQHTSSILIDTEHQRNLHYVINENEKDKTYIQVVLPEYGRPTISKEIVDDSSDFINGFKVVKMANREYAYLRQSDFQLLPYRYDVASDFNEYGFAMVGKDGRVSWIDTDFRYLDLDGEMIEEDLSEYYQKFNGWQEVRDFSQGDNPLSKVYNGRNRFGKVAYFGIDGKIRKFYSYNGEINYNFAEEVFENGSDFDEQGWAIADGRLLFSDGVSLSFQSLIMLCEPKGFLKVIIDDAKKCLAEKNVKVLQKEYKSTSSDDQTSTEK